MSKEMQESEIEQWERTLPRRGNPSIPADSLKRVSLGVAARIARTQLRRSTWQIRWQPALSATFTIVLAGWLLFSPTAHKQSNPSTLQYQSGLITAFAPHLADSTLSAISMQDMDNILSDETSNTSVNEKLIKEISVFDFDADKAIETMSPAERTALLKSIESDRNLDWSEML